MSFQYLDKRYKIYGQSELILLEKGQTINTRGGEYLYIIVKGCINMQETRQTSYDQKLVLQFISLYQGSHFGEISLGYDEAQENSQNKQSTIRTALPTYLLKLHNNCYKELITNSIEDDFEKKLTLISSIDILRNQTKVFITPLVSNLTKTRYKYGEVIIRQGESINKLFILAEGQLQILLEERVRRKVVSHHSRQQEKSFVYREFKKDQHKKTQKAKSNSFAKTFYFPKEQYEKSLLYGNKKLVGDELEFTDHVVFGELKPVSIFGGRTFYNQLYKLQKQKHFPNYEFDIQARLNVVCNSLKCTMYELDYKKFNSLPDSLQKVILDGMCKSKEFDDADIQSQITERKKWKDYTSRLVDNILKTKNQTRR